MWLVMEGRDWENSPDGLNQQRYIKCEIGGFHSVLVDESGVQGCYIQQQGYWAPAFRRMGQPSKRPELMPSVLVAKFSVLHSVLLWYVFVEEGHRCRKTFAFNLLGILYGTPSVCPPISVWYNIRNWTACRRFIVELPKYRVRVFLLHKERLMESVMSSYTCVCFFTCMLHVAGLRNVLDLTTRWIFLRDLLSLSVVQ
jgi:hypothetical protein